jgi:adenosylhomocysteinase
MDIKDESLAEEGSRLIEWAAREMAVLNLIKSRFEQEKPFIGIKVAACLHVTSETANLMLALKAGGANVHLCASNPLSTQDPIASALAIIHQIPTFAINGEDGDTYYRHIHSILNISPQFTMDDGADLVATTHTQRQEILKTILGGTEETTTGVIRLRSMASHGALKYPIIAVNDASTKHLFDNRYGTGQSTLDGITRATNVLWAGKTVVVSGYGWCGRGIALRAHGMGSQVIVTEVDPVRALEAIMDGYRVMPIKKAAELGDIFITATGGINAIDGPHFGLMKNGAIIANSGHFNVEINIPELERQAKSHRIARHLVEEYTLPDSRRIFLLAEGRLINLAAAEGHPSAVMDMSFANQALALEYLQLNHKMLAPGVYPVPSDQDASVANLKLASMGMAIDELTKEQSHYLQSWETGT